MAEPLDQAPPGRARETGPALEFHYRFLLWLVPAVEHYSKFSGFLHRLEGGNGGVRHVRGLSMPRPQIPGCWIPAFAGMAEKKANPAIPARQAA